MKRCTKVLSIIIFTFLPLTLFSQSPVVILDYMKVNPGQWQAYLEVEQEWKKIHQKKIEAGITTGWQLWRKLYATPEDEYQYITINWYENFAKTLEEVPEGFYEFMLQKEWDALIDKTIASRRDMKREVSHQAMVAEGGGGSKYIVLNYMKIKPGMRNAYYQLEYEIWKPIQEEAIKRGFRTHWGVWYNYPFEGGQDKALTVDGYQSFEQMGSGEDVLEAVHPDMTWEEITKKTEETRTLYKTEIWELVDYVFPE